MSKQSRSARDVADDRPDCADPKRKKAAAASLEFFCRTYLPTTFNLPWSADHRTAIARLETAVLDGGQFAYAMPRGSGKSSLAEAAALWAALFGLRRFVLPIGSDEGSALAMLDSIKVELETNDLLDQDFHLACGPIRRLEGIAHRCKGQLYQGQRTHIHWTREQVVMPMVPGSAASGAIIAVAGITGRIRGMKFKRPDGTSVRPDLAILDDPQTDQSARSPSQVQQREKLVCGAILGLAGPGKKIAAVMPCTVIATGDLADRLLDTKKHPEWQGARAKMMYAMPSNSALWEQYIDIRSDSLRAGNGGKEATDFYKANREAMDAGALPAWAARFNPDELSATQHAMNLQQDMGATAFSAEYQNDPIAQQIGEVTLTADEIAAKFNGLPRGIVPLEAGEHLAAFVDVQGEVLYWLVAAWSADFTGAVIDYGSYPRQNVPYFTLASATQTLSKCVKGAGLEGKIFAGLEAVTNDLIGREWKREDGAMMRIGRLLIDANWGKSTATVNSFCRRSPHSALLMPSHGKYVGAGSIPWEHYTKREGERLGHHWMIPTLKGKPSATRHVLLDVNYWKSFVHARLAVKQGDKTCLSLFGKDAETHRLLADHLTAEYRVVTEGRGRRVDEWRPRPGRLDNHWFDCIVGSAAGASMLGASMYQDNRPAAKRVKLSEIQKAKAAK